MKRSSCEMLLIFGIIALILVVFIKTSYTQASEAEMPLGLIGIILIVIAIVKWNSEKEYKRLKEHKIKSEHKVEIKKK